MGEPWIPIAVAAVSGLFTLVGVGLTVWDRLKERKDKSRIELPEKRHEWLHEDNERLVKRLEDSENDLAMLRALYKELLGQNETLEHDARVLRRKNFDLSFEIERLKGGTQ